LLVNLGFGQCAGFSTYMNPVIPGDHPDCTLTKVGSDFYTTGSSFNPTPVIYHSTDLVHWEAIAQPVSAAWTNYDTKPSGGCWGGQVVYYNNKWWDFFGMRFTMCFVTANDVRGPWSQPTLMNCPSSVPGLGADNSIFVDDNGNWYLLVKNGQVNNWIIQLGSDGQPSGAIYNMCWINPAPSYPYSWAEGPVMWKYHGYYYYCFARDVAGGQYFMRSKTLTDSSSSWSTPANFFNLSDPLAPSAVFGKPNHCSAAVMLDDSTSWVLHPVWRDGNNDSEWYGQGRQGLFNQVRYDTSGKPTADYPDNVPMPAPKLPSGGIPWMVPHSDFFESNVLSPEWSFLGYTPSNSYSLTQRTGWLTLSPNGKLTTVIKNDGEHNYSLITRLAFDPKSVGDSAGLWIFNGLQTLSAKLFSSIDSSGNKIVAFCYRTTRYILADPTSVGDSALWLKLVRVNHLLTGYCSTDGYDWIQVGSSINVADMDGLQPDWNAWTGNRQGLFVDGGVSANFDFYIYRDAYTPILAECPANQYGTTVSAKVNGIGSLTNIHDGDWGLYAGVEFGNREYAIRPDSLQITASCASSGGVVQVWLDSIDTGTKIAECAITSTGSWSNYKTFRTNVLAPVSGSHDVYLKFKGTDPGSLFILQWLSFEDKSHPVTSVRGSQSGQLPGRFELEQNHPNPFNPGTVINYRIPSARNVSLKSMIFWEWKQ
jgi:beta-xylosidase